MKFSKTLKMAIGLVAGLCAVLAFAPAPASAAMCQTGICGNGILDPGEECDDGNLNSVDGCLPDCTESFIMVVGPTIATYSGESPTYVKVLDLNNDGILDWVLTTARPSYLYTYIRDSSGNSTLAGRYPLGDNGLYIGSGSLNGDHFQDLVVADADVDKVFIFFGNGDGTMTLTNEVYSDRPRAVEVADLNTDGYDDIIIASLYEHLYRVMYGDGTGNFPVVETIPAGYATNSCTADLNGDGYNDLLLSAGLPDLQTKIFLGSEAGLGEQPALTPASVNVMAIDLNDDGYPDLLTKGPPSGTLPSTALRTYLNQGDATFAYNWMFDSGLEGYYWAKTDLNNDGRQDVVVGVRSAFFPIYLNTGMGTFAPEIDFDIPSQANQFGPIDYDNDGTTDLIIGSFPLSSAFVVYNHNYYQFPRCGDSRIGRGESCDDGNTVSGDGCSDVCRIEVSDDADHDGLADNEELLVTGTDPNNPDSDGDCVSDGDEYCAGDNPLDPSDQRGCQQVVAPLGSWHMLVTLLKAPADSDIDVYLASPKVEPLIKHSLKNVGKVSQTPVSDGDVATFSIDVGGEYQYYSDSMFGRVTMIDAYTYKVGFETLPLEQANWDYKDLTLLVEFVAKTPAVGIHTNSLDEFSSTQAAPSSGSLSATALSPSAADDLNVVLDFDGFAYLSLPAGAVEPGVGVMLTAGLPDLYKEVADPTKEMIGKFYKVNLTNGADGLADNKKASITMAYDDADNDGFVDGTALLENELVVYRFDNDSNTWQALPTEADPGSKVVTAQTSNFSLFALGGKLPERLDGKDSDFSANYGLFGCVMGKRAAKYSMLNIIAVIIMALGPALAYRIICRKREKAGS